MAQRGYLGWMVSALIVALAPLGCATADIDGPEGCSSDSDCAPDVCDLTTQKCVTPSQNNLPDVNVPDANNPDPTNNTPDVGIDAEPDEGPVACVPTCADNETCVDGACVSACMPACEGPAVCTAGGCQIPDCAAAFDPCDPSRPNQAGFVCADVGEGEGVCLVPCAEAYEASNCATGSYCYEIGQTNTVLACLPSECSGDAECAGGTCLNFENSFGLCLTAGTGQQGATCSPQASCAQGLFCDYPSATATSGICETLCDPFSVGSCGPGAFCGPFVTAVEALCTSDQTTLGTGAFDFCDPAGSWCADHTACIAFATDNICISYCRPGTADCAGVLPDGTDGVCNNYVFAGNRETGICDFVCDPTDADPCGPDAVCVDAGTDAGKCRQTCTVATVVADCCGGSTPCNFVCNDGLCE